MAPELPARSVPRTGLPPGAVRAVLARPDLWPTAVRQALRLAEPGWWRRPPRLPIPPAGYLRFRLLTNYGGDGTAPGGKGTAPEGTDTASGSGRDVVAYLEWCRAWPEMSRRPG